ncbi:MAG: alpha/beta hydrolase [Parachlamydiales bacterium]|nr:alpha/beta hydrolase [Parachlamydiales bacterium]
MPMHTGTCSANDINIHYLRTGGDKPSVVLLHGLTMNGACWTDLALALEKDYDVVMPDARGHGKTSAPHERYSYDILATDVLILIETLRLNNPVLVGHSMGGMTAAVVASQATIQLRGLVLADPTFLTPKRQQEVYDSDVLTQHVKIIGRSKEDFLAELQMRNNHRSYELLELIAQARFQTSSHAFKILKPPNSDYTKLITTIDIPTLLIIGDNGAIITPALASELARSNKRIRVEQIKDAGHGIPYDQPEHFASVVKDFLSLINA